MNTLQEKIKKEFPDIVFNEPLSRHSTFFLGGPADYFFTVKKSTDLPKIIDFARKNDLNYYILGGGSNVLFDDKGFRGLVIKIKTSELQLKEDQITADAGVLVSKLLNFSLENGLTGLEKWVGLPGTVGGAVRGNAGCNGLETREILAKATLLDPKTGETKEVNNEYFNYSYRHSTLHKSEDVVVNATFQLRKADISKEEQQKIMTYIRKFRLTKQPFGLSSGSFFKNPSPEKPAGLLIDQAGLKGFSIGKAKVSEVHANFLVNDREATSADLVAVALHVKKEVKKFHGIDLEPEVQIISEHGKATL